MLSSGPRGSACGLIALGTAQLSWLLAAIGPFGCANVSAAPDFSGVWGMVQHDRLGAPLHGPPPIAKTLGPQGTAAFLTKGAGLISQLDQSILRRVTDLSF